ncbi:MAG: hypothetical protein K0A94_00920 [Desulfuromonadales bacterium]|nr:hypothetical protein [Desulfuromonadales bacterium]
MSKVRPEQFCERQFLTRTTFFTQDASILFAFSGAGLGEGAAGNNVSCSSFTVFLAKVQTPSSCQGPHPAWL